MAGSVWAVVVAAGAGTRFGEPKQFAVLGDRTVLAWAVGSARGACDGVVLVVPAGGERSQPVISAGADIVVAGAATRSGSVRAGLGAVPDSAAVIVIHDAARPLAAPELFARAVGAIRAGADGAVCAVPVTDTLKLVEGVTIVATVDRSTLVAVQTPQAFRAEALRAAHAGRPEATDDASVVEAGGGKVVIVAGDPRNLKLTHASDLKVAAALLHGTP